MKLLTALVLTLLCVATAGAQTQVRRTQVYRCGPDGRELRDSPCNDAGAARAAGSVDYDQPGAADSKAARDRHLADARQAAALAQARRASEAEARSQRAHAVGLQSVPPPAQAASAAVETSPPLRVRPVRPPRPARPASGAGR